MTINEHLSEFAGKPIQDWEVDAEIQDPANTLCRIRLDWEESEEGERWTDKFAEFLNTPGAAQVFGIVVGPWDRAFGEDRDSTRLVEALVTAHERLPQLRAIFVGDITYEEMEISWIQQSDVSPILDAYPDLEHFGVRGGQGLQLGLLKHDHLKTLVVQTGGLNVQHLRAVTNAQLPNLEHLELWLGDRGYGWDGSLDDVKPLLYENPFPALKYLGLRDSEIADEIAAEIVQSPIIHRIEVLDLSLGTLTDEGAEALLASPALPKRADAERQLELPLKAEGPSSTAVSKLRKLDIHHHCCTENVVKRLRALAIEVDASDAKQPEQYSGEEHRYVSVGE